MGPTDELAENSSTEGSSELIVVDRRVLDPSAHPNLEGIDSIVLKDGPRARKVAKYLGVRNRHTGEVHHHALTIETYRRQKDLFSVDIRNSVTLVNEPGDEIRKLRSFIDTVCDPELERAPG
jgi:hypothetical protein